jgi:hypothetical protein
MRCDTCGTMMVDNSAGAGQAGGAESHRRNRGRGTARFVGLLLLGWGGLATLIGFQRASESADSREAERQFEAATELMEKQFTLEYEAREARHRALMADTNRWSGRTALRLRQSELDARVAHDPRFADSGSATNLLALERLQTSSTLSEENLLEEVARLSIPSGSRIEVLPEAGGFRVRIAYPMSAFSRRESDVNTRHSNVESLRMEAEERTFDMIRDIMTHAEGLKVRKLEVACNHGIHSEFSVPGATEEERRALSISHNRCIYRVRLDAASTPYPSDWRSVSDAVLRSKSVVEDRRIRNLRLVEEELPGIPTGQGAEVLEF